MTKMKIEWDPDSDESSGINSGLRQFADQQDIDLDELMNFLETSCYKMEAHFPNGARFEHIRVSESHFESAIINDAIIYSKEPVPPYCFSQPDVYRITFLKHFPETRSAILFIDKKR